MIVEYKNSFIYPCCEKDLIFQTAKLNQMDIWVSSITLHFWDHWNLQQPKGINRKQGSQVKYVAVGYQETFYKLVYNSIFWSQKEL